MSMEKQFESRDFNDEKLVTVSTETVGSNPSQKSLWAQAELQRRLMESIRKFDEATSHYSKALIALTFTLLVIALLQIFATVFAPFPSTSVKVLVFGGAVVIVGWTFWKTLKDSFE